MNIKENIIELRKICQEIYKEDMEFSQKKYENAQRIHTEYTQNL